MRVLKSTKSPMMALLAVFLVQMTAVGCMLAALPYFVKYILVRAGDVFTLGFVALTVASILAMAFWVSASRRVGKAAGLAWSLALFAGAIALMLALSSRTSLGWFYALTAVMGVGLAGTQLFPFAMLPDAIDMDADQSGLRREGVFSGVWAATEGIGMALGGLAAGTTLDWMGLVESTTGVADQPASALLGIRVAFCIVPAVCVAAAILILRTTPAFGRPAAVPAR
jgi:Na+/melibiose symporter-like transporter